ncbi:hypothetical protein N657DRAFT_181524 [Parathielavia appendiculata]|uniref:Uncharacterized protein n=1 Tax=Parathielavia appendiculata TaxID=2587402 RepID=A0AAN6U6U1_9PEZI|nr:hypothetical protein N657DRAFT_181524 [Parathielavia appendiculata]
MFLLDVCTAPSSLFLCCPSVPLFFFCCIKSKTEQFRDVFCCTGLARHVSGEFRVLKSRWVLLRKCSRFRCITSLG